MYNKVSECMLNVFLISSLCSSSHSERFLIPVSVVLHQVPAVQLQQGWLGSGSFLTLPSHHGSQSWKISEC